MPTNILMPALSPTMEEGTLAKWLKNEGDPIKSGDVIAEIETDKATMEVEAVDEGVLAKILIPAGTENVKVNTAIAIIAASSATHVRCRYVRYAFSGAPTSPVVVRPRPRSGPVPSRTYPAAPLP